MYIMNKKVFYNIKNISCIFVSGKKVREKSENFDILFEWQP